MPHASPMQAPPKPTTVMADRVDADPGSRAMLRGAVALGLVGIALVHFLDLFSKFEETPYLGFLYLGLIATSLVVAIGLLHGDDANLWLLAAGLAAATFAAYAVSRTLGLPSATDDIGNWTEPLGLASLFIEGLVVVLSVDALVLRDALKPPSRRTVDGR